MAIHVSDRDMRRILSLSPCEAFAAAMMLSVEVLHYGGFIEETEVEVECCDDCEGDCERSVTVGEFNARCYEDWARGVVQEARALASRDGREVAV